MSSPEDTFIEWGSDINDAIAFASEKGAVTSAKRLISTGFYPPCSIRVIKFPLNQDVELPIKLVIQLEKMCAIALRPRKSEAQDWMTWASDVNRVVVEADLFCDGEPCYEDSIRLPFELVQSLKCCVAMTVYPELVSGGQAREEIKQTLSALHSLLRGSNGEVYSRAEA